MVEFKELEKVNAAEVARKELEKIQGENEDGLLRAEDVVETARHPDNPLHTYFTWDDSAAADQWRLMQARQLIRKVIVTGPGDDDTPLPKYVSLRSDRMKPGGGYRSTNEVVNNKDLLAELEDTAKRDIDGVLQRYEVLKKLVERVRKAAGIKNGKEKKR